MSQRKTTRQVVLGDEQHGIVRIGGGAPVSVQSMVGVPTYEIDNCVAEINRLTDAGADLVRVAVPAKRDTDALTEILAQVSVPIIADVHFHFRRAMEAIEAGVHKIRLNPGNINDRNQVEQVIDACKERHIPIRIGVNEGSVIERKDKQRRAEELAGLFGDSRNAHLLAIMIARLEEYIDLFDDCDFHDIVISAKTPDPVLAIDIYTQIAQRFNYPLHLGITHAGPRETAMIRSCVPLGALLANGIGDTLRISYASDPVDEVKDALELLYCLNLRKRQGIDLIACPTCGRVQVDLISLVRQVRDKLLNQIHVPIKVAVMGCIVNGPGEAEGADVAVCAGNHRGTIYVQGRKIEEVSEKEISNALLKHCLDLQARIEHDQTTSDTPDTPDTP